MNSPEIISVQRGLKQISVTLDDVYGTGKNYDQFINEGRLNSIQFLDNSNKRVERVEITGTESDLRETFPMHVLPKDEWVKVSVSPNEYLKRVVALSNEMQEEFGSEDESFFKKTEEAYLKDNLPSIFKDNHYEVTGHVDHVSRLFPEVNNS